MRLKLIILAAALATAPLRAHDFWLVPSTFQPAEGERVSVSLLVGENLIGEPVVRRPPSKVERFTARVGNDEVPVTGRAGADPAGAFTAAGVRLIPVVYQGRPGSVTLTADKFEKYLKEEGLERIIEIRRRRGESAKPGRELFSRSAKALIAPAGSSKDSDERAGLALEIIAERNPYAGVREVSFRVEYEGRPQHGMLVTALNGIRSFSARTDRGGRVRFDVSAPGLWMIKTVHMVELRESGESDWHSIWASLTFAR